MKLGRMLDRLSLGAGATLLMGGEWMQSLGLLLVLLAFYNVLAERSPDA